MSKELVNNRSEVTEPKTRTEFVNYLKSHKPMSTALYYSGTTILLTDVAGMLIPDLLPEHNKIAALAVGDVTQSLIEPNAYMASLEARRKEGIRRIVEDTPIEVFQARGKKSIAITGTEYLIYKRGLIPFTPAEVNLAFELREDPLFLNSRSRTDLKAIAKALNETFHQKADPKLKRRTPKTIGTLYSQVDRGQRRGIHTPPSDPKYKTKNE